MATFAGREGDNSGTLPIGCNPGHRRIRRALLVITLLLIAGLVLRRITGVAIPRSVGFRLVMFFILLANAAWWTFADEALTRLVRARRVRAGLRIGLAAGIVALVGPIVPALAVGRFPNMTEISTLAAGGFELWHMGLCGLLPVVISVGYLTYGAVAAFRLAGKSAAPPPGEIVEPESGCVSRRELLKAAGIYSPIVIVGGASVFQGWQTGRFAVRCHDVAAPWLPDRLRGLTLTQVSDLHLGRLYRPSMLPRLVEAVNRLNSDLVCVTGDIVDLSNDMLPPGMEALRQLEHRCGLYVCLGNHDVIDNRAVFIRELRTGGFDLLINERRRIDIGGERITIAGLDWSRREAGHVACTREALAGYDPADDGPCIALAHHPHAFDALADAGVPLTLSGHTHGGQLMFRAPRADGQGDPDRDVGIGRMLFRYVRGMYHRADAALFVNSGVGNWFPIRVNAPAEIVQLRLV